VTIGLAIAALTGISGSASVGTAGAERSSAAVGDQAVTGSALVHSGEPVRSRSSCPDARRGLGYYRRRHADWLKMRGVHTGSQLRAPRNCADAHYLVGVWKQRALQARIAARHYLARQRAHLLRDYAFRPGNRAWLKAVQEAQKVFPGTNGWLLSCSAAEGGWGRWVGYGGQGYSAWLRDSDTVGGNLQYRWSTFKGHYRRALDYVRKRGFVVPPHLRDPGDDRAWRSALGQALAGGWARFTGNDDSHWSASWSRGC
jgi:hypothetical protein